MHMHTWELRFFIKRAMHVLVGLCSAPVNRGKHSLAMHKDNFDNEAHEIPDEIPRDFTAGTF